MKKGTVSFEPGKPLRFGDVQDDDGAVPSNPDAALIAAYIKAYRLEARNLLSGRFAGLRDFAPPHLREVCNAFVLRCTDGMVIRYDRSEDSKAVVRLAVVDEPLIQVVRRLSDGFVHVVADPATFVAGQDGPAISLNIGNPTGHVREIVRLFPTIVVSATFPSEFVAPPPPARPLCLAAVQPILDLDVEGVLLPADATRDSEVADSEHFIAHTPMRLPVGWEAIEVYPPQDAAYWDASRAAIWAELDILAAAAQANLKTQAYSALDGRGETRKQYANLLAEFESLLAGPEEPVHQFIKKHPELLCPTAERTWSKMPFGDHISDFVFREATNDYLLVEIEAPLRELFRKDGQQRQEVTHAIKQTSDWVQFIEENKSTVESALGLSGISTNPRRLVVIGRSAGLTDENRRELVSIQNTQPKLRILTYDEVLAAARTNLERILGPLSLVGQNTQLYFFKPKPNGV